MRYPFSSPSIISIHTLRVACTVRAPQIPQNRYLPCCVAKCYMQHWPIVVICSTADCVQIHHWCQQTWLEHTVVTERFQTRTESLGGPKLAFSFIAEGSSPPHPSRNPFREKCTVSTSQRPDFCFPVSFPGLFRLQPLLLGQQETTAVIPTVRNKASRGRKSIRSLFFQGE